MFEQNTGLPVVRHWLSVKASGISTASVTRYDVMISPAESGAVCNDALICGIDVTTIVALKDAAVELLRWRISGMPVVDGDRRVLGVVSETDILAMVESIGLTKGKGGTDRLANVRAIFSKDARRPVSPGRCLRRRHLPRCSRALR